MNQADGPTRAWLAAVISFGGFHRRVLARVEAPVLAHRAL
jgi:hypothetical protein